MCTLIESQEVRVNPEARQDREEQIARAAYALLEDRGYAGVSMLSIAKAAKASNETLYRWYGDKAGLFLALVRRNAETAQALLDATQDDDSIEDVLRTLGPVLLEIVTGPRAVALNRAAAADPSGALGRAIAEGGREAVLPKLCKVFENAIEKHEIKAVPAKVAAADYISLLIGDMQIRRVIGVLDNLGKTERAERSERAMSLFLKLYGNSSAT
jgi:AcrR family transcriptional regulator